MSFFFWLYLWYFPYGQFFFIYLNLPILYFIAEFPKASTSKKKIKHKTPKLSQNLWKKGKKTLKSSLKRALSSSRTVSVPKIWLQAQSPLQIFFLTMVISFSCFVISHPGYRILIHLSAVPSANQSCLSLTSIMWHGVHIT